MRKVEVAPYNEMWSLMFEQEADQLKQILGKEIIDVEHIGSTSVKGMKAKPVIDIMPIVRNIQRIDQFDTAMIDCGYEPKGENGISARRYFQKGGDNRTHHVHIYETGNPEIERHLAFRDYLRTHPKSAQEYSSLKEELSSRFPCDIASYINGKEALVQEIERKAMLWYQTSI